MNNQREQNGQAKGKFTGAGKAFVEGVITSLAARMAASLILMSIAAICQFFGHVAGDILLHVAWS